MARRFTTVHGCGFRSSACRSQAQADYALRRHVCEKYQRAAEAHARGLAKHAAIDRTPKPCLHKVARHEHGTYACYVLDGCRCLPCAAATSDYERDRIKKHAFGRYDGLIDAAPTRAQVRDLMASGLGLKRIAALAGIAESTLGQVVYGKPGRRPPARIRPATASKLLAVRADFDALAGGAKVQATGTHRRVQALIALGWSQSEIGRRIGMNVSNVSAMMRRPQVSAATARAVRALYDELWNCPPPETCHRERNVASRARNFARRNGWLPPLAWDDDTIDDPAANPAAEALRPAGSNHKWKLPPVEDLQFLLETGESIAAIASRYGASEDGVLAALRRHTAA